METIKPQELRIGNFVKANGTHHGIEGFPDGTVKITGNGIKQFSSGVLSFDPIALSPNILLRFGFNEKSLFENIYEYSIGSFRLQTDLMELFIVMGYHDGVELLYVHQLQNLYFALTGQELTPNIA